MKHSVLLFPFLIPLVLYAGKNINNGKYNNMIVNYIMSINKYYVIWGFPGGTGGKKKKNPPANAEHTRDTGSIPRLGGSTWSRKWEPTPVVLPGESHGQRSLAGYSPRGHKG